MHGNAFTLRILQRFHSILSPGVPLTPLSSSRYNPHFTLLSHHLRFGRRLPMLRASTGRASQSRRTSCVGFLVLAILAGPGASGIRANIVLYDHLVDKSNNYNTDAVASPSGPLADSFSTGSFTGNLTDVKLVLQGVSGLGGSTLVQLLADSNSSPGTPLATIATINNNALPLTHAVVDLPLATPYALAMNTRYWVELSPAGQDSAQWAWAAGLSDPGVAGEFFYGNGAVHTNGSPYLLQLSAAAVPEPSSYLLVALASLGWGTYHRLRRRRVPLRGETTGSEVT
jgi:hypothetical protein